ncbi:hypothetical protein BJ546DRAFT_505987 [Cryomyces antarcticus]
MHCFVRVPVACVTTPTLSRTTSYQLSRSRTLMPLPPSPFKPPPLLPPARLLRSVLSISNAAGTSWSIFRSRCSSASGRGGGTGEMKLKIELECEGYEYICWSCGPNEGDFYMEWTYGDGPREGEVVVVVAAVLMGDVLGLWERTRWVESLSVVAGVFGRRAVLMRAAAVRRLTFRRLHCRLLRRHRHRCRRVRRIGNVRVARDISLWVAVV